ncbi:MAG: stage V sporulation protein T [Firmicutes bacterium]|nr:stage V sporulation protein T [Bacillota bacterium]
MKATGIVRRIDDLGRVVIPKEIRRTMKIREGDPLEIFVDREGEVILKKYSPIGELEEFAQEYADALNESTDRVACICDRDTIVAVAGAPKKEFVNRPLSPVIEKIMEDRRSALINNTADHPFYREGEAVSKFYHEVIAPIVSEGDPIGAVIMGTREQNAEMGEMELKLVETAAFFLAKQMEQ